MKNQFIERLNSILQKRNLSQADLSKMTGIRSSSISDWLNGKYEPKQDKIAIIAESNVPLKAIMERVGHNEPRTTLAIYTHVTDEMKQEVNVAITNMGKILSTK